MSLNTGQSITARRHVNPVMVTHWKYAKECASIREGLVPGADLKIVNISKVPGQISVQGELPGRYPTATLKISGEDYSSNFQLR